jgi:hypothetical protein
VGLLAECVLLETLEEKDHSQNLDIDEKLTLKRTFKQDRYVDWIDVVQNRNILGRS